MPKYEVGLPADPREHTPTRHQRTMSIGGTVICICCESVPATQEDFLCDPCREHEVNGLIYR